MGFGDLLDAGSLEEVAKRGIHAYLNYDGYVILSSVMRDELLIRQDIFDQFCKITSEGELDAVIGWDTSVYLDMPLFDSWINLLKGLEMTYELCRRDVPVLGLAKGNVPSQISFSVQALSRMGIKDIALHASEYLYSYRRVPEVRHIVYSYASEFRERVERVLVLGALSPFSMSFVRDVFSAVKGLSFAGLSWYLDAKRNRMYSQEGAIRVLDKFPECSCPICIERTPLEIVGSTSVRAKHNLNYLKQSMVNDAIHAIETYDLIIDKGRTVVLSDIHIGTPKSLVEDCLEFLEQENPRYILFLGDIFDLQRGRPSIHELTMFFGCLKAMKNIVLVIKGCSDSDNDQLLKFMDRLVYMETARPFIYRGVIGQGREKLLRENLLDFYRFYRMAKESAVIKLPSNEVLHVEHGHEVVPDQTVNKEELCSLMTEERRRLGVDWLMMGHSHRAFLDEDKGIACPGCW